MIIFDWIFAIAVFGFIGAVVFGAMLQGIATMTLFLDHTPAPRGTRVPSKQYQHQYDYDTDI
jgi:hypothetical protein